MHCSWRINDTVALKKTSQITFYWVAASVDTTSSSMSSVCSLNYPSHSLADQNLFFTLPVCISWFLLGEDVALTDLQCWPGYISTFRCLVVNGEIQ